MSTTFDEDEADRAGGGGGDRPRRGRRPRSWRPGPGEPAPAPGHRTQRTGDPAPSKSSGPASASRPTRRTSEPEAAHRPCDNGVVQRPAVPRSR